MRRVVVSVTQPDKNDPDGDFDILKDYHVDLAYSNTKVWLSRLVHWAIGDGNGILVEPFRGKPEEWNEFRPRPQRSDDKPVGKHRRPHNDREADDRRQHRGR